MVDLPYYYFNDGIGKYGMGFCPSGEELELQQVMQ